MSREFLSGNEAVAQAVRLCRPHVISAYPITPQTIVVERLSEMVEDGSLNSEFIHVESEHSALSCAIGASSVGARTFTATSSQGLLYMAECLIYASGGRFPIVMMNANRSLALPWNIYGDQRDALALLDSGWIQVYAQDGQEALDLTLQAYRVAEDPAVSLPYMVNLDGFQLTHTYEVVDVPEKALVDEFLPHFDTENRMSLDAPKNLAFSTGPEYNEVFLYKEHQAMLRGKTAVSSAEADFARIFGRSYPGLIETFRTEDAETVLITLGSISPLARDVVKTLRSQGKKVGLARIRYMRPFPGKEIAETLAESQAGGDLRGVAVLERDISFGGMGTVYTNVAAALKEAGLSVPSVNYVGGFGGHPITEEEIVRIFSDVHEPGDTLRWVGIERYVS
jgi:pyruvate ferredoxin oxidoreductase alpha subunit